MYIIYHFTVENPRGKSLWMKIVLSLIRFVPLEQNTKIKICHVVAIEHPDVIEGRMWLIFKDFHEHGE